VAFGEAVGFVVFVVNVVAVTGLAGSVPGSVIRILERVEAGHGRVIPVLVGEPRARVVFVVDDVVVLAADAVDVPAGGVGVLEVSDRLARALAVEDFGDLPGGIVGEVADGAVRQDPLRDGPDLVVLVVGRASRLRRRARVRWTKHAFRVPLFVFFFDMWHLDCDPRPCGFHNCNMVVKFRQPRCRIRLLEERGDGAKMKTAVRIGSFQPQHVLRHDGS